MPYASLEVPKRQSAALFLTQQRDVAGFARSVTRPWTWHPDSDIYWFTDVFKWEGCNLTHITDRLPPSHAVADCLLFAAARAWCDTEQAKRDSSVTERQTFLQDWLWKMARQNRDSSESDQENATSDWADGKAKTAFNTLATHVGRHGISTNKLRGIL